MEIKEIIILGRLSKSYGLNLNQAVLLMYLNNYFTERELFDLTNEDIAKELGLSTSSIKRYLDLFKKINLITIENSFGNGVKKRYIRRKFELWSRNEWEDVDKEVFKKMLISFWEDEKNSLTGFEKENFRKKLENDWANAEKDSTKKLFEER